MTTSNLSSVFLLMAVAFVTYIMYFYLRLSQLKKTKPFKEIPTVPNAHWLLGHFPYLRNLNQSSHHSEFLLHASPSGLLGFWIGLESRGFTVLRADHVRAVLRQNSSRETLKWVTRHGRKTLGADALILLPGGLRWKQQRNVVGKMFRMEVMQDGKYAVAELSRNVVKWLLHASSPQASYSTCPGHDGKGVCIEAEHLFQLYSLEVFGKVGMGYDFNFFANPNPENCSGKTCHCLKMSDMARSWTFLQGDLGKRTSPQNVFNPLMQFYWLPTNYNREYRRHVSLVNGMMHGIIGEELNFVVANKNTQLNSEGNKKNLVTHLVESVLEDQLESTSRPSSSDLNKCPFSGSSSSTSKSSGRPIPRSSLNISMSPVKRQEIIDTVSGILRTLLVAGFET
jgi:hypothetical protein